MTLIIKMEKLAKFYTFLMEYVIKRFDNKEKTT